MATASSRTNTSFRSGYLNTWIYQQTTCYSRVLRVRQPKRSFSPRIHSTFNFVQGHVCEKCNTGWMSRLERVAKPILVSLIEKERTIESLSLEEAEIAGRWAVKTAYMHSWTSPLKRPVQLDHLKALLGDDGRPFPGVGVFGMQSDFKKQSAYFQPGFWPQLSKLKENASMEPRSRRTTSLPKT